MSFRSGRQRYPGANRAASADRVWLVVGVAYVGGRWFAGGGRMDFVRFSGELFIYYVLIALGGGVLTAFTLMMFSAIGMNAEWLAQGWLIPCGAMGAVIVGSWLVEAKQSVIENMAPVLTRLFTPLFTVVLLAFLATMAWTRQPHRRGARGADRLRSAAGAGRWPRALRRLGARPGGTARLLRRAAAIAGGKRPRSRRGGASGNRGAVFPSSASLPTEWRLSARISSCSSTSQGRRGSMLASCVTAARLPHWSDGRSPTCPCTPCGRRLWSSFFRPCSATVDISARRAPYGQSNDPPAPCITARQRSSQRAYSCHMGEGFVPQTWVTLSCDRRRKSERLGSVSRPDWVCRVCALDTLDCSMASAASC